MIAFVSKLFDFSIEIKVKARNRSLCINIGLHWNEAKFRTKPLLTSHLKEPDSRLKNTEDKAFRNCPKICAPNEEKTKKTMQNN